MGERLSARDLARRVPDPSWISSVLPVSDEQDWLPLVRFDEDRCALVITRLGCWQWVSNGPGRETRLHKLEPPEIIGAVTFLEMPPESLSSKLAGAASMFRVPVEDLIAALPIAELVTAALDTRSDYWIDRALTWIEGASLPEFPFHSMREAVNDRNVSQNLRHRVRQAIQRLGSGA